MSDEIKEEIKCNCKEKLIAKLKEFTFIAGAVFVGGTLSILVSASLLKPKCPMGLMGLRPGIHRSIPPMMMHEDFDTRMFKEERKDCPCHKFKKHHRGEFKGAREEFKGKKGEFKKPPVPPTKETVKQ